MSVELRLRFQKDPSVGWILRHIVVLLVASAGTYAFMDSRLEWSAMHRWNRAFGDMSLVLVALALTIGPVSRLWKPFRIFVPWRREFGIYAVLLAIVHTVIVLRGWIEWDLIRLFGYEWYHITGLYVMRQHGFGLANVIGIVALAYGIVLAFASNNRSQRFLGGPAWKFLQQRAYVLWMLVVLHTAYFLFLHFQTFHRRVPDPNWAQVPFVVLIGAIAMIQVSAFLKTWRAGRRT